MLLRLAGERARSELGQSVSATTSQRLKVSREGLLLIKSFEGFRPRTVRRRDGVAVIGYGHTRSARPGATITEASPEMRQTWAENMDNAAKTWAEQLDAQGRPASNILSAYMDAMRDAGATPLRDWDKE